MCGQFAFPRRLRQQITLAVPDMMCEEGCAAKVREVLVKQPGVERVNVDFSKRIAKLAVDKSAFDADAAVAALVDHGFEHSQIKTDDLPVTPIVATQPSTPASSAAEAPTSAANE